MNRFSQLIRHYPFALILLMAVVSVAVLFIWQSRYGFSLMDEGFLWYGAQRVMVGEIPIRDFMAYDIGRYYWSAAIMSLMGDNGIVALRISAAVFQALALFIGVAMLARSQSHKNLLYCLLAMLTLMVWMAEQFRIFDISIPIIMVAALTYLIEKPDCRRYFLLGMIVGLAAIFGRNHGVYGVVGSICALLYLTQKHHNAPNRFTAFKFWISGIALGYLPVMIFIAAISGFGQAFWESIVLLFESGTTNPPLPVPWPWLAPFGEVSFLHAMHNALEGTFFLAIAAFSLLGIVWLLRNRKLSKPTSPILWASIFLAIPYAHYAFSRADITHLAPAIPPLLLGVLALLSDKPARIKWSLATIVFSASLGVMLPMYSSLRCQYLHPCSEAWVGNDQLYIDNETANNLIAINKLSEMFAPSDRTFIAAPFWPGAYAVMGRKSPVWESYMLLPRNRAFQLAEITRIKAANPGFVLLNDFPLDNREELRFRNSHSIIDQYIRNNFIQLHGYTNNPDYRLYKSKM